MQNLLTCITRMFWGIVLVGVGITAAFFCNLYVFECIRLASSTNQGQCELSTQGIWGSESQSLPITSLQGADIEVSTSVKGNKKSYRVVIQTSHGDFPFSGAYNSSGKRGKQKIVREIHTFINTGTQQSIYLKQDDRWIGYLLGGVFGIIGITLVLCTPVDLVRGNL